MSDDEPMSPELANRIADAVEDIEQNIEDLHDLQGLSRAEYQAKENQLQRDAAERKFEKLTAAVIDIAETILRAEGVAVPDNRKATITVLNERGIIGSDLKEKLDAAVGFRDVLAHSYGPIVNDDIVYNALQNDLERYIQFVTAVDQYLSEENQDQTQ
jgi:uncharacterized protein YutE (UPF0331/DUF86 family)